MDDINTNEIIDEMIDGLTDGQANHMAIRLAVAIVGEHAAGLAEVAHCMYNPQPDTDLDYRDAAGLDLLKIVNCLIKWTMDTITHFDKNAEAILRKEYDAVMNEWHNEHGAESPFISYKE